MIIFNLWFCMGLQTNVSISFFASSRPTKKAKMTIKIVIFTKRKTKTHVILNISRWWRIRLCFWHALFHYQEKEGGKKKNTKKSMSMESALQHEVFELYEYTLKIEWLLLLWF